MNDKIDCAQKMLSAVTECEPIDWDKFDKVLQGVEDINILDEDIEETILSEFLVNGNFLERGDMMIRAIEHFLANGYDVSANGGKNGTFALSSLCWSAYDQSVLDAAKLLMDAGAVVRRHCDDCDAELDDVLDTIGWKLSGAWTEDKDYHWANILEAYYSLAEARADGKDYRSIGVYSDCISLPLLAVFAGKDSKQKSSNTSSFTNPLVLRFGDKPLVIRPCIDFAVNPVYVQEHRESLADISEIFSSVLGAVLRDVKYTDSSSCCFHFDNGIRLHLFTLLLSDKTSLGMFELKPVE